MEPLKLARPSFPRITRESLASEALSPADEPQTLADWEMVLVGGGEDIPTWP